MKKYLYAIIPLVVILGPLAMSFDSKVNFIQYLFPVLISTLVISAVYIFWDVLVTRAGHWRFNDEFVGKARFLDLPLGEWLFFIGVPYACLFIYEVVVAYFGKITLFDVPFWLPYLISALSFTVAILLRNRGYSLLAFISVSVFFALSGVLQPQMLGKSEFLLYTLFCLIAFLVVNGTYTALPTIFYNPKAFSGIRLITIPLEDFFYNTSLLGFLLLLYLELKKGLIP